MLMERLELPDLGEQLMVVAGLVGLDKKAVLELW
jgi:hypothetical protein